MKDDIQYLQNEVNIKRTQLHLLESQLAQLEAVYKYEKFDKLCRQNGVPLAAGGITPDIAPLAAGGGQGGSYPFYWKKEEIDG